MMHDRTFLARLCVDIDGVNMLVIFPRRRGCWESSCIRSSCGNAVVMLLVMLVIFFWGGRCHGTFTFQKCQKMTIGNLPPQMIIVILPPQKIPLAKNRCPEGNGAENAKENSRLVAKKPATKENTSAVIKCFSSTLGAKSWSLRTFVQCWSGIIFWYKRRFRR